jgi:hypothetical protein
MIRLIYVKNYYNKNIILNIIIIKKEKKDNAIRNMMQKNVKEKNDYTKRKMLVN